MRVFQFRKRNRVRTSQLRHDITKIQAKPGVIFHFLPFFTKEIAVQPGMQKLCPQLIPLPHYNQSYLTGLRNGLKKSFAGMFCNNFSVKKSFKRAISYGAVAKNCLRHRLFQSLSQSRLCQKLRDCLSIALYLCLMNQLWAADTFFQNMKVGVVKMESPELSEARESIEAGVEAGMQGSHYFTLVERRKLARLLEEIELRQSGLTCEGNNCQSGTPELQNIYLQAADKVIIPLLDRQGSFFVLILRCVDVKSGKIDYVLKSEPVMSASELIYITKKQGRKMRRFIDEQIAPPQVRQDIYVQLEGGLAQSLTFPGNIGPSSQFRLEAGYPLAFGYLTLGGYANTISVVQQNPKIRDISYLHYGADLGLQYGVATGGLYFFLQPFVGTSQHVLKIEKVNTIIQHPDYEKRNAVSDYAYTGGTLGFGYRFFFMTVRYQYFLTQNQNLQSLVYSIGLRYYTDIL